MHNPTILQGFEWYLPANASHWKNLASMAASIKNLGFSHIWLPPASKAAAGTNDVGYGTYDLYDLGEFSQKGTVSTKYGTKDEYITTVQTFHQNEIKVLADIVLNHFIGADETEVVNAQKYSPSNRTQPIGSEETIEAWTKFTFPGRNKKYCPDEWNWNHFSGVDWDNRKKEHAIFELEGKTWDEKVDREMGNFDYLMGADLDMQNPEVVNRLKVWGKWFLDITNIDGFRLDAIKHIDFSFFTDWLSTLARHIGRPFFAIGEYWSNDLQALTNYLDSSGMVLTLFDVPLHFNLMQASRSGGNFDMQHIFSNTLIEARPDWSVTFVDNHDTQPGQALESWIDGWFKPLAYALILLREEGIPCVFYGDLYGIPSGNINPVGSQLHKLLKAREKCAYGRQVDYLDHPHVIGWTRTGNPFMPHSGMAVLLSDGPGGEKRMNVGAWFGGQTFYDCLGNHKAEVIIEKDGNGLFPVSGGSVSVWVPDNAKNYFVNM